MKRRDFLRGAAVASFALSWTPGLAAQRKDLPDLSLVQGESPFQITREAIVSLGGMKRFVTKGDKVLIKPNIGWDRTPELAACTNPEVIKALVELSLEAGAKRVIVIDNPTNQAKRAYLRSGISEAAKQAGAEVLFPNPLRLKKMPLRGEWLKEWEVFQDIAEADKIVNVPIAKTHSLCRVTLGMKNWLGAIGGSRNQLHQKLDEAMVDLAAFFKPVLTVLDAYRILFRNGPQGGRVSDTKLLKTVIASVDPVAADTMGASFFDIPASELPFLSIAQRRGLGEFNVEKLRLEKRTV